LIHDLRQFVSTQQQEHHAPLHAHSRVKCIIYFLSFAFLCITVRLIHISMHPLCTTPTITRSQPHPMIYDTNHTPLSAHLPTESLYINALHIINPPKALKIIQNLFPNARHQYIEQAIQQKRSFIWVKRHITPQQKEAVLHHGLVGCSFLEDWKRIYPFQNIVSHIVGFRDIDGIGATAIERYLDQNPCEHIHLSIDIRIQGVVHRILSKAMKKFRAKGAGAILLNIETGEVLAMCSLPDFDPNDHSQRQGPALFNSTLQGSFEFGSIMKIFTLAQCIEEQHYKLGDTLETVQPLSLGKFTIKDHYPKPYNLTVAEAFLYSSNIGMVQIYKRFQHERQKLFLEKMGVFSTFEHEILESSPAPQPGKWSFTRGASVSYGYGVAFSPLQFLTAAAATVSGKVVPPTFLKHPQGTPYPTGQKVLSKTTATAMRKLLFQTTQHGTARRVSFQQYGVGAKTGSACKRAGSVGYNSDKHYAFIVAFFPIAEPKYALLVMLDEPQGTKNTFFKATAGWTAGPTAQKIIKRIGPILNVPFLNKAQVQKLKDRMAIAGVHPKTNTLCI